MLTVGKYRITADPYNFILEEGYYSPKHKETRYRQVAFTNRLEYMFDVMLQKMGKEAVSKCETFLEVLKEYRRIKEIIEEATKKVDDSFYNGRKKTR
jgi:hypothetical protein